MIKFEVLSGYSTHNVININRGKMSNHLTSCNPSPLDGSSVSMIHSKFGVRQTGNWWFGGYISNILSWSLY